MPPKHKRPKVAAEKFKARRRPRGETSSQPIASGEISLPPQEEQLAETPSTYSNPRFISLEAEQRYCDGYSKRIVLCERGINLTSYSEPPYELNQYIYKQGWQRWVAFQHKAVVPLVKEFYSNVIAHRDESENRCLITEVRKVKIEMTPAIIAELFSLPREPPLIVPEVTDEMLEKPHLAKLLTGREDAEWNGRRLPKANLSPVSNILHRLVCSHFLPQAYTGSVTFEQAVFLGKMLIGIHVDLGKHIFDIIDSAAKTPISGGGLPFGGFITWYLFKKGVKERAGVETILPMSKMDLGSLKRSEGQLKRKRVETQEEGDPSQTQEVPSAPVREEHSVEDLYQLMAKMQSKQKSRYKRMKKKQKAMFKELKDRQEEMFNELKVRQQAIYSGLMRMHSHYKDLESKVESVLESSSEESKDGGDYPTESDLAEAEKNIQGTIAIHQSQGVYHKLPEVDQPLPSTLSQHDPQPLIPSELASTPVQSPSEHPIDNPPPLEANTAEHAQTSIPDQNVPTED